MPPKNLPTMLVAFTIGGVVLFAAGVVRSGGPGNVVIPPGVVIMIFGLVMVAMALGAMTVYRFWSAEFKDLMDAADARMREELAKTHGDEPWLKPRARNARRSNEDAKSDSRRET